MTLYARGVSVLILALLPVSCATPLARMDSEAASTRLRTTAVAAPAAATATATPAESVRPDRLQIAAIGVDSSLEKLRVTPDKLLAPPVDPARAGWFPGSAVPGEQGPAVIAGHRDSVNGPAVFWRLTDLRPGNRIKVTRSDGRIVAFEVVQVRRVARKNFPTEEVYGPTPDSTLRLITCGGLYDHVRGRYLDNVLVLAVPV